MNKYIGVDYNDEDQNNEIIMKVSVLSGLDVVENITYHLNAPKDMLIHLEFLAKLHEAKICFENNQKLLFCLFSEYNKTDLLIDFADPCDFFTFKNKRKGICMTQQLKDYWNKNKSVFNYDTDYERPTMIAALKMMTENNFAEKINRISILKNEIKRLEHELQM